MEEEKQRFAPRGEEEKQRFVIQLLDNWQDRTPVKERHCVVCSGMLWFRSMCHHWSHEHWKEHVGR